MAWRIDFTRNADKAMRKLDKGVAARVFDELDEIAKLEDPRSRGKALTGNLSGVWRYRVGDYRILCDINDGRLVILVVDVAHRREVYKRSWRQQGHSRQGDYSMAANAGETKVKLWEGICYPENMRDDWQDEIDDILQVPFAYAVHDIDHDQKSKQRKTHAHVIVVWGGNTTRKAIINVLNRLSADGKKCCSSAEPINNIRHAYDYLIHDTASCRKKGKELYPVEARIEGNNFDIGQLEQLSTKDKQDMLFELVGFIMCERFETINDFTAAALREFPEQYREIIVGYNSILERYCRGNYLNAERKRKRVEQSGAKE